MNSLLKEMLDCDVTLYMGPHVLKGAIGETDSDDVLVLHTDEGKAMLRIEHISGFIFHPYNDQEDK